MYPKCLSDISQMSFNFKVTFLLKLLRKLIELFLKIPNTELHDRSLDNLDLMVNRGYFQLMKEKYPVGSKPKILHYKS